MRADLPERVTLVCPRCRRRSERGWELHTVELVARWRSAGDEVLEGELACVDPACAARYPILDGVPILLADLAAVLSGQAAAVVEAADATPEAAALVAAAGPDDAPYPQLLDHLSIYLDAHWGDRATPPPDDSPAPAFGFAALAAALAERAAEPVDVAVELGASVGRGVAELARGARLVIGVDLHFGALRRARRLLAGETVRYARRAVGRHYRPASVHAGDLARPEVALLCADAQDPPLAPSSADRVVALNVVDSVRSPETLLAVVDGLCAPGGELVLASPFAFHSSYVDDDAGLGADPPAALADRLRRGERLGARYTVEETRELAWTLRRDARCATHYRTAWLRATRAR